MTSNLHPSHQAEYDWTPNQIAKRETIVRATAQLMAREGLTACTTRTIAANGKITPSAIHYYFRDTVEIIDLAMRYLGARFWGRVRAAADAESVPVTALWCAAEAYLDATIDGSSDGGPTTSMLWAEFETAGLRLGNQETVRELSQEGASIFTELVAAILSKPPQVTGRIFYAALLGSAVRDKFEPRSKTEILAEMSGAFGIPLTPPSGD